jgi:putative transposase
MPRDNLLKDRFSQAHQLYHVTLCTDNRKAWFNDLCCGRIVVHQMHRLHEEKILNSMAWVLMPDHLHWLFELGEPLSLSNAIKAFKARSALELNVYLKRKGSIWQRGFYDHALRKEEDIKQIARYIVANPLRAGLVEQIGDYPLWDAIWL